MQKYSYVENGRVYIVKIVEDLGDKAVIEPVIAITGKGRKFVSRTVDKDKLNPLINAVV